MAGVEKKGKKQVSCHISLEICKSADGKMVPLLSSERPS